MKKLLLAVLIVSGTLNSLVSCQDDENTIYANDTTQEESVLISKEYSPSYYAGLKMRKFEKIWKCGDSIGFCPSSKLQEVPLDEYTSMTVSNDLFKVKITPLSDNKINMNVIVNDGYFVGDLFEIAENVHLTNPSITLKVGSYPITKIGSNEYSINIDATIY